MNQVETILWAFQQFGGKITLGEALKHSWGYKLTSRISDLRLKHGYKIDFIRGETPSQNAWVMTHFDKNGQGTLL